MRKCKGWSVALLFFLGIVAPVCAHSTQELRLVSSEYPPITFTEGGKPTGLAVEVVQEIQHRVNDHGTIAILPFARSYKMALIVHNVAMFATMRTRERETLFKWVGPLTIATTSFYALRSSGIVMRNMEDAKAAGRILVPSEYYSKQVLSSLGFTNLDSTMSRADEMLPMLTRRRANLIVADDQILPSLLKKAGLSMEQLELSYSFLRTGSYIAFSRDTPDAVVQRLQAALDDMKRDGSFARIYVKWLPNAAPPGISASPEAILEK
jgi:polar amino acid transport system substrate-binding protein